MIFCLPSGVQADVWHAVFHEVICEQNVPGGPVSFNPLSPPSGTCL